MDTYDWIALVGFGLVVGGVGMVSVPAALITGGVLLMAFGLFGAKANAGTTVSEKPSE